jgi:2-C-methyl-D-erythritol 4-phosphate cytidylyltransferase/2-C-methyl-D-erythritol 2,4-cyclodiphosphate synthase
MQVTALIVAAGSGSRMGGNIPKQYRRIGGKAVLAHAVDALAAHPRIGAVRVVVGDGHQDIASEALAGRDVGQLVLGGAERADSVRAGLAAISGDAVLVHDAARSAASPMAEPSLADNSPGNAFPLQEEHLCAVPGRVDRRGNA